MAKDEKLNKWINNMTPRRAIQNFFDNATPVDSPDPDEIFEPVVKCVPPEEEVTPVAGSSQSSQRNRVQKRKLADDDQSQGNVSKKNDIDETQTKSLQNDSIFGTSEFPSRLESPSLVVPPRPNKKNKKRMSFTAFASAIQSQQSTTVNTSDDLGESSVPSVLGSPRKVSQRPLRSKKRSSVSIFEEPLGGKQNQEVSELPGLEESGSGILESSGIPSNLHSPEYVSSQNRSIQKSKSRVSTTTFKKIFEDQHEQDSGEIPSSLDSPEKVQQVNRFVSKSKARMSTTAFSNLLEVQYEQDSGEIPSSLDSPEKLQQINRFVSKSKARISTTAFSNLLKNQQNQEEEVLTEDNLPDPQPDLQQSDFQLKNQSSRMSKESVILPEITSPSVANVSTLRSKRSSKSGFEETNLEKTDLSLSSRQRTSMAIEPRRSIRLSTNFEVTKTSLETSSKASNSELSDQGSMPELESPNEFSLVTSPTQITKSKQSGILNSPVESRDEILNRPSNQSYKEKSIRTTTPIPSVSINISNLEIPSQLNSPQEYKQYIRPGPASSKKKVSTTGFLTALSQKNDIDIVPSSNLLPKGSTRNTSNEITARRETLLLVDEEKDEMNSRPFSRASSKSSSSLKNSKRSTVPLSESDESDADLMLGKSVSSVIKEINRSLRSNSQAANTSSASSKSNAKTTRQSKLDYSDPDNDLFSETASSPPENTGETNRSTNRASNKSLSSSKSSAKTTYRSKLDDSDPDNDLFSKTASSPTKNTNEITSNTSRASNKSLALSKGSAKTTRRSKLDNSDPDNDLPFSTSESQPPENTDEMTRSTNRTSNKSLALSKASAKTTRRSNLDDSDSDNDLFSKTASSPPENTGEITRSISQASNKSLASSKSSVKTTRRLKLVDHSDPDKDLFSKDSSSPPENTDEITRSTSRASNKSLALSKASAKTTRRLKLNNSDPDNDLSFSNSKSQAPENTVETPRSTSRASRKTSLPGTKNVIMNSSNNSLRSSISRQTPSPTLSEKGNISSSSGRASQSSSSLNAIKRKRIHRPESDEDNDSMLNKSPSPTVRNSRQPPKKSLPTFSRIILGSESESEPEATLSKQITEPISTKTSSSIIATIDEAKSSSSMSGSRLRKSLKFGSPTTEKVSSAIQTIVANQPLTDEAEVEETPPSDSNSTIEEVLEEDKSTDEIEEEEEVEELSAKSTRSTHSSRASSKSSRKSGKQGMSPSNRYPALKNSTVVAGGAAFFGAPLSMSPIRPGEQGAPLLIMATPKSSTSDSTKAGVVTSTSVKSPTPKTVKKTPLHPSTPAPFARKRTRSTTQSPMFMNVMKSSVKKAMGNVVQEQQRVIPATPTTSRVSVAKTSKDQQQLASATLATSPVSINKNVSSSKGLSISNPGKGKSLVMSAYDKMSESSDTEWEDESDQEQVKPRCINIAFEEILKDRSKDFVPLEKRLLADPVFQAKVKTQRAKVAAQKAAEKAAAIAKKNETKKKKVAARKKEEDNIASVAVNKGNLRFYARTKVSKEALDAVHGLAGEWLDFTLDQMENFCIDEGKPSLDSWQDCYKMMKRQGIVKNYMEYSGLCHELLLNDECAQLLPTSFPPEYYDCKREAKRQKK